MPEYPEFERERKLPAGGPNASGEGRSEPEGAHIYADGAQPLGAQRRRASESSAQIDIDFKSLGDRAQSKGRELGQKLVTYSRENPEKALISAVLSGYVAGKLLRLVFRGGRRARRYRQYQRLAKEFA